MTPALNITPRQAEVLSEIRQGKSNKEIARDLGLSTESVKAHVARVLRALNVSSRTQAVVKANRLQPLTDRERALVDALFVATEHNAMHFGQNHNIVIQGRTALADAASAWSAS